MKVLQSIVLSGCILFEIFICESLAQSSLSSVRGRDDSFSNRKTPSTSHGPAPAERRQLQRYAEFCAQNPTPFRSSVYVTHIGDGTPFQQPDLNELARMVLQAFNTKDAETCDSTYRTLKEVTIGNVYYTDALEYIRLRYDVNGSCTGCLPGDLTSGIGPLFGNAENLAASTNNSARRINENQSNRDKPLEFQDTGNGRDRRLQNTQLQQLCGCSNSSLTQAEYRGPTPSGFAMALNSMIQTARNQNNISGVSYVKDIFEASVAGISTVVPTTGLEQIQCSKETDKDFITSVWIEAEGTKLVGDQVLPMEVAVAETFNEMNFESCDLPSFPIVARAQLVGSQTVGNRVQMAFDVRAKCVNCDPATFKLFNTTAQNVADPSLTFGQPSQSRLVSEIDRLRAVYSSPMLVVRDVNAVCSCPLNRADLPYRAPTATEFAQVLNATVKTLGRENLLTSITTVLDVEEGRQLSPTGGPPTVMPTSQSSGGQGGSPSTSSPTGRQLSPTGGPPTVMPTSQSSGGQGSSPSTSSPTGQSTPSPASPSASAPSVSTLSAPANQPGAPSTYFPSNPPGGQTGAPTSISGDCGPNVEQFDSSVFVDFDGQPDLLTQNEITAMEQGFKDTYNSLNYLGCDLYFRTIRDVTLTPGRSRRRRLQTFGGATSAGNVIGLQSGVPSVYRIVGKCRACPVSRSGSFKLFDDAFRLRHLQAGKKGGSLPRYSHDFSQNATIESAVVELDNGGKQVERHLQQSELCLCAPGATPDAPYAPTLSNFQSKYNDELVRLQNKGLLTHVKAVTGMQEVLPSIVSAGFSIFYGSLQRLGEPQAGNYTRLVYQTNAFYRQIIFDHYNNNPNVTVVAFTVTQEGSPRPRPDLDKLRVDFMADLIMTEDSIAPPKSELISVMQNANYVSYIVDYLWKIAPSSNVFHRAYAVRFSETEALLIGFPLLITLATNRAGQKPTGADVQALLDEIDPLFENVLVAAGQPVVRFTANVDAEDISFAADGSLRMDFTCNVVFADGATLPTVDILTSILRNNANLGTLKNNLAQDPSAGTGYFASAVQISFGSS